MKLLQLWTSYWMYVLNNILKSIKKSYFSCVQRTSSHNDEIFLL